MNDLLCVGRLDHEQKLPSWGETAWRGMRLSHCSLSSGSLWAGGASRLSIIITDIILTTVIIIIIPRRNGGTSTRRRMESVTTAEERVSRACKSDYRLKLERLRATNWDYCPCENVREEKSLKCVCVCVCVCQGVKVDSFLIFSHTSHYNRIAAHRLLQTLKASTFFKRLDRLSVN